MGRIAFVFALAFFAAGSIAAEEKYVGPACAAPVDDFFANEVWLKVGAASCLECHKAGGDAEDSKFILIDPQLSHENRQRDQAMRRNRDQFVRMALEKEKDQSRLLLKVIGKLRHGGKIVLKPDSAGYKVLAEFVRRLYSPTNTAAEDNNAPPFFDSVIMLDNRQLLRRVTLSLAGRLPRDDELQVVGHDGLNAFPKLLDAIMTEDAFYTRLREGF